MNNDIKIILGSEKFKSSIDTDNFIPVSLYGDQKEMDEFDRSAVIGLSQVFDEERQSSNNFRLSASVDLVFYNAYDGTTPYDKFRNQLYYSNSELSYQNSIWKGFPQYQEFDLARIDNNVSAYTSGSSAHINFVNRESSFYNWNFYITYPYENDEVKKLKIYYLGQSYEFSAGDGIPYNIFNPILSDGQKLISFYCMVEHNVKTGDFVQIMVGTNTYIEQVYLVDDNLDSRFIFILANSTNTQNYTPGNFGTFKRILDINNPSESTSKYYVKKHKVLSRYDDAILNKAGFEQNGFGVKRKFEFQTLTPNKFSRISELHGTQSYILSFNRDIDTTSLKDNLKRPISQIFITIINRGRFGWFNKPIQNDIAVREGFDFNLDNVSNSPNPYWSQNDNQINLSNIKTSKFTQSGNDFFYNNHLDIGDTINGDFCEFNPYEQIEHVLSENYHKFYFNSDLFTIEMTDVNNPPGYYYKPHHPITLKVYSDYIEEGNVDEVEGIPNYAFYSSAKNSLIWRDIYTYGYIDDEGKGVDYPFLNGSHYPSTKIIFKVKPEGFIRQNFIVQTNPEIDECE